MEIKILKHNEEVLEESLTSRETTYNNNELILLAKLIQSEALGEPYEGKLAVGEVVINRMNKRQQTMKEVIYAKSQFSGVNGRLFKSEPSRECIKAAKEALKGSNISRGSQYFTNLNVNKPSWTSKLTFVKRVGNHWFYK